MNHPSSSVLCVPPRAARFTVLVLLAGCASAPAFREASPLPPPLPAIVGEDLAVVAPVLEWVTAEYTGSGSRLRVAEKTMTMCDTGGTVLYLDCIRSQTFASLENRWVTTRTYVFDGIIADSTRAELAAAFRRHATMPVRITGLDSSRFITDTGEKAPPGNAQATRDPNTRYVIISRPALSADQHAFVYVVFSRNRFATGMIFLLRKTSGAWEILSQAGVWVT